MAARQSCATRATQKLPARKKPIQEEEARTIFQKREIEYQGIAAHSEFSKIVAGGRFPVFMFFFIAVYMGGSALLA